ncbi:VOC family protein [Chitinophaga deserti]|uniref:VOC family protein n=1 Tax=Chitinophaga deserti TaxID=2164099 RepID=UPI000D6C882E|nr:VOC family protein [Chitinophaga deserti]
MAELSLLVIKTDKMQEQQDFYTLLGFTFEYHKHGNGPFHYASTGNGFVLEIYPLPKSVPSPDNTTRLGFKVSSLEKLVNLLNKKGIKIISQPAETAWGFNAIVEDHDGRKIELTEVTQELLPQ